MPPLMCCKSVCLLRDRKFKCSANRLLPLHQSCHRGISPREWVLRKWYLIILGQSCLQLLSNPPISGPITEVAARGIGAARCHRGGYSSHEIRLQNSLL